MLQEGGLAAHEFISAEDKDFAPIFEKLCLFATVDIFAFASDFGGVESKYDDDKDALTEAHEACREDMFLDDVYGRSSRVSNEAWLKSICGLANWVLHPEELRKKIFEVAGVSTA